MYISVRFLMVITKPFDNFSNCELELFHANYFINKETTTKKSIPLAFLDSFSSITLIHVDKTELNQSSFTPKPHTAIRVENHAKLVPNVTSPT